LSGTYSGLATRVGTALAIAAVLLACLLFLPAPALAALIALLATFAGREWARLCGMPPAAQWVYALVTGAAALALYLQPAWRQGAFVIAAAFWLVLVPIWLWRGLAQAPAAALASAGIVVLAPSAAAMMTLPVSLVITLLVFTTVADAAAYFVGSRFGRRKLAPSISPGKSWEGAAGGLAAVLVYAALCTYLQPQLKDAVAGAAWVSYLLAVAVLFAASVLGDLFESAAKRRAGVKDSGSLLPGHGGILDRVDSATAALPIAAALWPLIGGK
jgi:phosphatidate cytidylyltransferase